MPGNPEPGMHGKPAPSPSKSGGIDWNPFSWFQDYVSGVSDWLGGLGGDIASGVEGGTVAVFKDLWSVILPFVEILLGMIIAFWAISIWLMSTQAGQSAISSLAFGLAR